MKWKLVNAYFEYTYWPKIKPWNDELFAREGRTKITLFNPYSGSIVVCPIRKYEKAYLGDIEDGKKLKWYRKLFNERRQQAKQEPTVSYWGRWNTTNAKEIIKTLNQRLKPQS